MLENNSEFKSNGFIPSRWSRCYLHSTAFNRFKRTLSRVCGCNYWKGWLMPTLLELSWLVPATPLIGGFLVSLLLFSFNRTINRLTKPISIFIIICLVISTIFSFTIFEKHITGVSFPSGLNIVLNGYHWNIYVDMQSSIVSSIIGLITLIVMTYSFVFLQRRVGYVRYFAGLGLLSGLVFMFIFSGEIFHQLYDPLLIAFKNISI